MGDYVGLLIFFFFLKKLHIITLFKMETFNPRLLPLATSSSFCWKGWGELYRDCHTPLLVCSVVDFNASSSESLPSPLFFGVASVCFWLVFFFPTVFSDPSNLLFSPPSPLRLLPTHCSTQHISPGFSSSLRRTILPQVISLGIAFSGLLSLTSHIPTVPELDSLNTFGRPGYC